jgi:hypothetical protein
LRLAAILADVLLLFPGNERAVLIWCYGGAASLEEAGHVYEPD